MLNGYVDTKVTEKGIFRYKSYTKEKSLRKKVCKYVLEYVSKKIIWTHFRPYYSPRLPLPAHIKNSQSLYNNGTFPGINVDVFLLNCIVYHWRMIERGHVYIQRNGSACAEVDLTT